VFAFAEVVDMRKSFDTLGAIVREQIKRDVLDGALFVFVGRDRRRDFVFDACADSKQPSASPSSTREDAGRSLERGADELVVRHAIEHHRTVATKKAATKKAAVRKGAAKKTAAKKRARVAPGAPLTQDLYTGMSGQFAAMSEFLWRGYNVAIPAVDVGEDIFVVEAENNVLRRVQVKTAGTGTRAGNDKTVQFGLSRGQLNLPAGGSELYFMLLTRWDDVDPARAWRFILIRSDHLNRFRLTPPAGVRRRGRPPLADATAGDDLTMKVLFTAADAVTRRRGATRWPRTSIAGRPNGRSPVR